MKMYSASAQPTFWVPQTWIRSTRRAAQCNISCVLALGINIDCAKHSISLLSSVAGEGGCANTQSNQEDKRIICPFLSEFSIVLFVHHLIGSIESTNGIRSKNWKLQAHSGIAAASDVFLCSALSEIHISTMAMVMAIQSAGVRDIVVKRREIECFKCHMPPSTEPSTFPCPKSEQLYIC